MIVAGVDVGSLTGKAVIIEFNSEPEIKASSVVPTTIIPARTANKAMDDALQKAGLNRDDVQYIVGTGYGRIRIPFANQNISEITCHGRGAHYFLPSVRTIVDIGGQDCKVIKVDETGKLLDFAMNDKCAAGTGRFLEVMAKALETTVDQLGPMSLKSKRPALITSQCSVFAESEVISLVAEGKSVVDIVAGIHHSVASRIMALVNRVGLEPDLTMTGGVAKNIGVRMALEEKLGQKLKELPEGIDPQIIGAFGAALIARDELQKKQAKPKKRKLKEWNF
ncbi:MAG: acyl-CoA dehydratase activase [Candidatus Helarchaeota archaeon]